MFDRPLRGTNQVYNQDFPYSSKTFEKYHPVHVTHITRLSNKIIPLAMVRNLCIQEQQQLIYVHERVQGQSNFVALFPRASSPPEATCNISFLFTTPTGSSRGPEPGGAEVARFNAQHTSQYNTVRWSSDDTRRSGLCTEIVTFRDVK